MNHALRAAGMLALLGVLVPLALVGAYNSRPVIAGHPALVQRVTGALIPVLYPASAVLQALVGVEEREPRYAREFYFYGALSLATNSAIYVLAGGLVAGARALARRLRPSPRPDRR